MIERATLEAFDGTVYTATVRFAGSLTSVVAGCRSRAASRARS